MAVENKLGIFCDFPYMDWFVMSTSCDSPVPCQAIYARNWWIVTKPGEYKWL